ncbi:MAG: phosphoglucomutase/phosphomannomutase family protein [Chloroflexi bacterium]|nr:phosphoglucomutase/phosphomannomutase family protein [Chloroflexota bacterium]
MVNPIKFGTDGWRGIIAEDYTFANVRICAQAVADYLRAQGLAERALVVGYDTRFASEDFAAAVAEVAAGNNIQTFICEKPTPTPTISYGILAKKAGGAVIITASHNPARWNGLKYKPDYAGSASPEIVAELESRITFIQNSGQLKQVPLAEARERGLVQSVDLAAPYLRHLGEMVDLETLRQAGLKIVADAMYGAGSGYFPTLLQGGKTQTHEIHGERNPLFPGIQPEPIAQNLTELGATIRRLGADVGLATDGDSDRLGIVDENGVYIDQLHVFPLLALYLLEVRHRRGAIIKSMTTSRMLYKLGQLYQSPVYDTPVGFKYIGPKMISENALIGGEESGGYGFQGHIPERDGILAGLYFLDLMVNLGKRPSELVDYLHRQVGQHHYDRLDLSFPPQEREAMSQRIMKNSPSRLVDTPVVEMDTSDGFRFLLADEAWLYIRFSGTEPILRIYAEAESSSKVEKLLAEGRKLVGL